MDYSDDSIEKKPPSFEEILVANLAVSSSEVVSLESDESSDISLTSPKVKLYKQGLYDPGSGEICAEYIFVSASSVPEHVYYHYPGLTDPGIIEAILRPEPLKIYPDDGQQLYLDLCDEMKIMSVGLFYRGLLGKEIDLRYYGISPKGVRAMCMALANNHTVQQLDLTGNFLQDKDACYHLGQMLGDRNALQSLVLSGCRIGPTGVPPLVVYLSRQRPMQQLDLSKNDIKDLGVSYLAQAIASGAIIKQLNLSYNDLSSDSALMLAKAFGFNDCVSHLDLSWNNFTGARGPIALCRRLGHSTSLVKLDLSWTGLHLTTELRILLGAPNLKILILSNNRLTSVAAGIIAKYMHLARRLRVLDLSSNPFMPADAMLILDKMRLKQVRVRELMMDNIVVSKEFYDEMQEILALRFRKYTKITHGTVLRNYSIQLHDLRTITIKRLAYTAKENKKSKVNMMDFIMEYQKTQNSVEPGEFVKLLSSMNMQLDHDTANELMHVFPGPKNENGSKTINLGAVVEYIYRLYPDKLPPPDSSPSASPPKSPPKPKSPKGKKKKSKKGN